MRQCYSSSSNSSNEDPLENYDDYKEEIFTNIQGKADSIIQQISYNSLNSVDKKLLLLNIKHQIEKALLIL